MRRHLLGTVAAVGLATLSCPASAADYLVERAPFDWSGLYAGLHAGGFHGYANINDEGTPVAGSLTGFIGGGLVGYGWQYNHVVLGIEGDVGFSTAGGTGGGGDIDSELFTYDLHWNAHLRGVLGWSHGNFKPFIAAGLAVAGFDVTEEITLGGTYVGWTLGGGVDVRFTDKIIGRAEVLYDDYGSKSYPGDYSASLTGWTARLAIICDLL